MKIELSHITNFTDKKDIHLNVSTEDDNNYFEKMLGLYNGRYLVIHAMKYKTKRGYSTAFIEGTIYDKNGEVCIVPNRVFHKDELVEIENWLSEHEKEWINYKE